MPSFFDAFAKLQFGLGVVGRTSFVVVAFILVAGLAMWALSGNEWIAAGIFACLAVIVTCYLIGSFWYANKYPNHAVLDGAQLVRHAEIEQAAKNPTIVEAEVQPRENTMAPPAITDRSGPDV